MEYMKVFERVISFLVYIGVVASFGVLLWEYAGGTSKTVIDHPWISWGVLIPTSLMFVLVFVLRKKLNKSWKDW